MMRWAPQLEALTLQLAILASQSLPELQSLSLRRLLHRQHQVIGILKRR